MFCCLQRLREEILIMKKYFVTCREALESKLLLQVCMRHESAFVVGSVIVGVFGQNFHAPRGKTTEKREIPQKTAPRVI